MNYLHKLPQYEKISGFRQIVLEVILRKNFCNIPFKIHSRLLSLYCTVGNAGLLKSNKKTCFRIMRFNFLHNKLSIKNKEQWSWKKLRLQDFVRFATSLLASPIVCVLVLYMTAGTYCLISAPNFCLRIFSWKKPTKEIFSQYFLLFKMFIPWSWTQGLCLCKQRQNLQNSFDFLIDFKKQRWAWDFWRYIFDNKIENIFEFS